MPIRSLIEANAAEDPAYMQILQENLEAGNERFFTASTLEKLASSIRIPYGALNYTLNQVQRSLQSRKRYAVLQVFNYLAAMEEGPWYAVKAYMQCFGTIGGLAARIFKFR